MPLAPGGFPRLSGMPPDAAGGAVRLGLSLEAGKVGGAGGLLSDSPLRTAGPGFTAVDTRFGPVYPGFGHTRHVGSSAYLCLGSVLLPSGLLRWASRRRIAAKAPSSNERRPMISV